jgi:hypothetical protein
MANSISSDVLKANLRRQSFFFDAMKHGATTVLGGIAGAVSYFGFGLAPVTSALIGVSTKAGGDMTVDLVGKPLYFTDKIADRAQTKATETK